MFNIIKSSTSNVACCKRLLLLQQSLTKGSSSCMNHYYYYCSSSTSSSSSSSYNNNNNNNNRNTTYKSKSKFSPFDHNKHNNNNNQKNNIFVQSTIVSTRVGAEHLSITKEMLAETKYQTIYHQKDDDQMGEVLRGVVPYDYEFVSRARERWVGMNIIDMFMKEYRPHPRELYEIKIAMGKILVNDLPTTADYVIKSGDTFKHIVHRHEIDVLALEPTLIAETLDYLVVDKPPSIPVHPAGPYRHNSLTFLLARQFGYTNLLACHRLDRLTSGVVVLAKNSTASGRLGKVFKKGDIDKIYLAKVKGMFPYLEETMVAKPIMVLNEITGLGVEDARGKPSTTFFKLAHYNKESDTSIIWCRPITGRGHQIRIHLKSIGFPITNDPLYNDDFIRSNSHQAATQATNSWNKTTLISQSDKYNQQMKLKEFKFKSKEKENQNEIEKEQQQQQQKDEDNIVGHQLSLEQVNIVMQSSIQEYKEKVKSIRQDSTLTDAEKDEKVKSVALPCLDCCLERFYSLIDNGTPVESLINDTQIAQSLLQQHQFRKNPTHSIHLHSYSYQGPDFHYVSQVPLWATPNNNNKK
ncbi:hypothetical protein DFA_02281 [Cavenderia fasciculata]|uniref:Pseudouridine synthase RsuA/RluA-like domain-containing protein n=1 Tax=Cavenderia fasciculata TaxID=261658 RepID=F4PZ09_CACFS|nr:uncharacterized protein DFA_02281 [Cavenderia fasciculata]EGG19038.1 hypothetical protein DFA_02281 [Cavenderia fasciculata]|eukprot:XP_004366671.1 hypothetical protein DFA_02281 [Cavenderia fasciculata]